jgi:hypothetical protein
MGVVSKAGAVRRVALIAAGLSLIAALGFAGPASAKARKRTPLKVGEVWTILPGTTLQFPLHGKACEQITIGPDHTWTANQLGDAGTYTNHKKKVALNWTSGEDSGLIFTGTWSRGDYIGTGPFGLGTFDNYYLRLTPESDYSYCSASA